ncbi:hypothetical protein [Sedimenticola sp.]|uniref:hypothetical protein n=1 Tax=Sedimenticola sp. TaxID=1940285 RepID=UPI003D0FE11B
MTLASSETITLLPLPFSPRQQREFRARLQIDLQSMNLRAFAAKEFERIYAWQQFPTARERRFYQLLTLSYTPEELARWIHLTIQENLPDAQRIEIPEIEESL